MADGVFNNRKMYQYGKEQNVHTRELGWGKRQDSDLLFVLGDGDGGLLDGVAADLLIEVRRSVHVFLAVTIDFRSWRCVVFEASGKKGMCQSINPNHLHQSGTPVRRELYRILDCHVILDDPLLF